MRPSPPEIDRPNNGLRPNHPIERPTDRPNRPIDRPNDRPNRPIDRPTDRPNRPVDRPTDRPNYPVDRPVNRPIIGGNNTIINRPGGNTIISNRPGGNTNINVNRPGWGHPGWGYGPGHGSWAQNWHDHYVNHHHNYWYHGCWSGHWGNNWYVPLVYGATAWGLAAILPQWGYNYGYTYVNPYYVPTAVSTYNYSQPLVVNNYYADDNSAPPAESPQQVQGYSLFDQAVAAFKTGDYRTALQLDQQAISQDPHDPLLHEFSALCMFAQGDYGRAAAVLNALLAVAPGMDWTTLSGLYPNIDVYTQQLRALEAVCRSNPGDAAANFVLAYQYLVAGHRDAAVERLKAVLAVQPKDEVSRRMLDSLAPPADASVADGQPSLPPEAPAVPGAAHRACRRPIPDDRPGGAMAGYTQRRRLRLDGDRRQPVYLEGHSKGQTANCSVRTYDHHGRHVSFGRQNARDDGGAGDFGRRRPVSLRRHRRPAWR